MTSLAESTKLISQQLEELSPTLGFDMGELKEKLAVWRSDELGPIVVMTPESRWWMAGGVGAMVDQLTRHLAILGVDVHVFSPFYHEGKSEKEVEKMGLKYERTIETWVGEERFQGGLHSLESDNIHYYFLKNWPYFVRPYEPGSQKYKLENMIVFAKLTLQACCDLRLIPSMIVTNDWPCGLCAGYARCGAFGDTFKGTRFFHIIHNLEVGYDGMVFPQADDEGRRRMDNYSRIHQLPIEWLSSVEHPTSLSPTRCALLCSDQYGTVSKTYRDDLLATSRYAPLMQLFHYPFAQLNGIDVAKRLHDHKTKLGSISKREAKLLLQKKYFGNKGVNEFIPLYGFVGRFTDQKGVELIVDAFRRLYFELKGYVQFIIGGSPQSDDDFGNRVAAAVRDLHNQYPLQFWANPDEFFSDGLMLNVGCDFGLVPSKFEPGGLVQQEFFALGTPVIAFATGGLKDSVFEFNAEAGTGNGFTFLAHHSNDLATACLRAYNVSQNPTQWARLQENAKSSVLDVSDTSLVWARELARVMHKEFLFDHPSPVPSPIIRGSRGVVGSLPLPFPIPKLDLNMDEVRDLRANSDLRKYEEDISKAIASKDLDLDSGAGDHDQQPKPIELKKVHHGGKDKTLTTSASPLKASTLSKTN